MCQFTENGEGWRGFRMVEKATFPQFSEKSQFSVADNCISQTELPQDKGVKTEPSRELALRGLVPLFFVRFV